MKNVNLFEIKNSQNSMDNFVQFALCGNKMNLVRGGGDPILPPPPPPPGGWVDDEEQP